MLPTLHVTEEPSVHCDVSTLPRGGPLTPICTPPVLSSLGGVMPSAFPREGGAVRLATQAEWTSIANSLSHPQPTPPPVCQLALLYALPLTQIRF